MLGNVVVAYKGISEFMTQIISKSVAQTKSKGRIDVAIGEGMKRKA